MVGALTSEILNLKFQISDVDGTDGRRTVAAPWLSAISYWLCGAQPRRSRRGQGDDAVEALRFLGQVDAGVGPFL